MPLTLVLPGLLAHPPERLAQHRTLTTLATFAAPPTLEPNGIEIALLAALHASPATQPAPIAAAGAGLPAAEDFVFHADPILLTVGEGVVLNGRVDDVAQDEAAALMAMLNAHFAEDALTFAAPRPDAWFARLPEAPQVSMTPLAAACNRPLLARLPHGPQAARWRRWQDEIQMLLHEHPVNRQREAAGRAPISGIWFWGGGTWAATSVPRVHAIAGPGRAGDVARGAALRSGDSTEPLQASLEVASRREDTGTVVVAPRANDDALESVLSRFLEPALAALQSGALRELCVVSDGHGAAATWRATRPTLVNRMLAIVRHAALTVPVVGEP
jgi:hypothetical protein